MTKQELLEMAKKLQAQAESMPDETPAETDPPTPQETTPPDSNSSNNNEVNDDPEKKMDSNGELEEEAQIEPQTNGKITDDITPKVDTQFEESTDAQETVGVDQLLSSNIDVRFATFQGEYDNLKMEVDKLKVAMAEILTRIELVQEVTDKVVTVDHDSLLGEAVRLLT